MSDNKSTFKKVLGGLVALASFLLGLLFLERNKRKSLEALNENNKALKEKAELDVEIEKNKVSLETEKQKRETSLNDLKKEQKDLDLPDLVDFFNRRK